MKKLTITRPNKTTTTVTTAPPSAAINNNGESNGGGRRGRPRRDPKPQSSITITRPQRDEKEPIHTYESKPSQTQEPVHFYETKRSGRGRPRFYGMGPSYESNSLVNKEPRREYEPSAKSYMDNSYESQPSWKEPRNERHRRRRGQRETEFTGRREPVELQPSGDPDVGILIVKGMPYRCHLVKSTNARVVSSRYLDNIKRTEEGISSECTPGGHESPICMSDNEDGNYEDEAEKECYSYEIKDVPSKLVEFIVESQREIESETKTKLIFGDSHNIVIQSYESQSNVKSAYDRIMLIFMRSRARIDYTHFVNIPLTSESSEFRRRLDNFHAAVRAKRYPGLDDSIFVKGSQMHLTVQMLRLLNEAEVAKASRILSVCAAKLVTYDMRGRTLHLRGLEYMNDDPSAVDVLYAKVCDFPLCIQDLCANVVKEFMSAGLVSEDEVRGEGEGGNFVVKFKFHATVVNTRFRKGESGVRVPFDARQLLKDFGDFDFGTVNIESIHLSQRAISQTTGFFKCLNFIQLNE